MPVPQSRHAGLHVAVGQSALVGVTEDVPDLVERAVGYPVGVQAVEGGAAAHPHEDDGGVVGGGHVEPAVGNEPRGDGCQLHQREAVFGCFYGGFGVSCCRRQDDPAPHGRQQADDLAVGVEHRGVVGDVVGVDDHVVAGGFLAYGGMVALQDGVADLVRVDVEGADETRRGKRQRRRVGQVVVGGPPGFGVLG